MLAYPRLAPWAGIRSPLPRLQSALAGFTGTVHSFLGCQFAAATISSIEHDSFIIFDFVVVQITNQFRFKRLLGAVFLLARDVQIQIRQLRFADGESAVAGQGQRGGELREQMDVGVISVRVFVSRLLGTRIHTQLPRFYAPDLNRTS